MITTILLGLLYGTLAVFTSPLRILPDVSLPEEVIHSLSTANGYIVGLNNFLPIDTLYSVLTALVAIELAILLYRSLIWIITKIPTISN